MSEVFGVKISVCAIDEDGISAELAVVVPSDKVNQDTVQAFKKAALSTLANMGSESGRMLTQKEYDEQSEDGDDDD